MSDDASTGSNPEAANEPAQPVTTEPVQSEAVTSEPPKSAREAVEKALATVNQIEQLKSDKPRTPDGKFAPKEAKVADAKQADAQGEIAKDLQAAVAKDAQIAPPARFTKQAQTDWANAPESIRSEVSRLEKELTQGIEKYRADAEAFEPLRQYHDMAKQHGTTVDAALSNYLRFDNLWANNPVQAFVETCRATRHDPQQVLQALVNGGQVQQQGPDPRDQAIQELRRENAALREEFGGIKKTVEQTKYESAYNQTLSQINDFAKDKPHFEKLLPTINKLIETKFTTDLTEAYDAAVRLNPDIAAEIESAKAAKAPKQPASNAKAALSITGSPTNGSNPTSKPAGSPREALSRSFASLGLA